MDYYRGSHLSDFPSDFSSGEKSVIGRAKQHSMTSAERMVELIRSVDYLVANEIKGDIVECGVWRGGSVMCICERLVELKDTRSRNIFLFDTFDGMAQPDDRDVQFNGENASQFLQVNEKGERVGSYWCIADIDQVKQNLGNTDYPAHLIHYVKGKVEETLPHEPIGDIALLRLDTDWYESTYHELVHLYDKVVPGGIIIIDDYGHWQGSKKAVDDFFKERNQKPFLHRIDYSGRLIVKS
jgi:O-methyltransferase